MQPEIIAILPKCSTCSCNLGLKKGISAKKIAMEGLQPFVKKIHGFTIADYSGGAKFRNGDTLLARITPCLENGKTAYVDILKQNEIAFGSTEFIVMRAIPGKTDEVFVYYLASSPAFRAVAIQSMTGTSGRQRVQNSLLENANFRMPAIEEQRAIGRALSALDDKIELNNRINKTLEEMAQALFKRWFVDFEFPDENDQPYKSSGGEMVESELGPIPKGWRVKQLGDVITLSTKTVNPQSHNKTLFEHFSIPCFDDKKTPIFEVGENIKSNKFVINSGNILVSKLNPATKRIWKPLCSTSNAVCSTEFMVYRAMNDEHTDFYYSLMDSEEFQNYLLAHVTGSTNSRQRVTPSSTLFFKYVMPADPILKKFVEIAIPVFSKTQINTIENCRLMKTRDSLLPKLMSGEIRVPIEEVVAHV